MNRYEVGDEIARKYKERKKGILNSNALSALSNAIPSTIAFIGKIFMGSEDASKAEELLIKQDLILDILYEIDNKISYDIDEEIEPKDIRKIVLSEIKASGYDADEIIGMSIKSDAETE